MDSNRKFIMDRLKHHLQYATSKEVNKDNILGIFAYGSMNYGYWKENLCDVDSKIIIVPDFKDICFNSSFASKELHYEGEVIDVKDIRELRNLFMKQNINYLQILYTNYFILNPKYEKLWKTYFIKNREIISHFDRQKAVQVISGHAFSYLSQNVTENKNFHNAYRLYYLLENYLNNKVFLDCLNLEGETHTFLWDLKFGLSKLSVDDEAKANKAKELEQKIKDLISMNPNLNSPLRKRGLATLNNGVTEIMKVALQEPTEKVDKATFLKQLTLAEQRAYYSIVKEIGAEGNIIVSKLIGKNSISRPVYNNLIVKMKECGVASVTNQGAKGMNIKILQPELKVEAMNMV